MGCVASRIDREERVKISRERKRLMKQLLGCRKEFADALLVYLRSLKNTGATLRQFTESESLELEENTSDFAFPPSPPAPPPPPPLPPPPPPPPSFSPDLRQLKNKHPKAHSAVEEEITEIDGDNNHIPPPPPTGSSWDYWDLFGSSSSQHNKLSETVEQEEENWAETNTEFIDEDEEAAVDPSKEIDPIPVKQQRVEPRTDDNSSMMSWHPKATADLGMVVWRNNKTLNSIVKDLDEYFLKAAGAVKNIAVAIDINTGDSFRYNGIKENKRKRSNSTKVFRALTWSWSLKSLQSSREAEFFSESNEPCKPGAHRITLQKLYFEEQKLHKDVKEEVNAKVEYGRKSLLLQRQEEDHDCAKAEKTRIESLESYILSMQESINGSYSTISKLINGELHPQIVAFASGLMHMWHTMHKCHQVQSHISQQLSHLADQQHFEPTSEYHLQAAAQLHTEVTSWYSSFCKLVKFQREYVGTLRKWTELTSCFANIGTPQSNNSLKLDALLGEWQHQLNNLHDKLVSEAIKGLVTAVEAIVLQQQEEYNMRKRSEKLGRKLERELNSLSEVEFKFEGSLSLEEANSVTISKNPLLIRRAKVEALKALVDDEKAKYVNCVKATQAMILNNLQTRLPNVFGALMDYSKAYVHSFEAILGGHIGFEQ